MKLLLEINKISLEDKQLLVGFLEKVLRLKHESYSLLNAREDVQVISILTEFVMAEGKKLTNLANYEKSQKDRIKRTRKLTLKAHTAIEIIEALQTYKTAFENDYQKARARYIIEQLDKQLV